MPKAKTILALSAATLAGACLALAVQDRFPVFVDGKAVNFSGEIINGTEYIKATDVAKLIDREFQVHADQFIFAKKADIKIDQKLNIGMNLIKNPGFEDGPGITSTNDPIVTIPQWIRQLGTPQVAQYRQGGFKMTSQNMPPDGGNNYFAGGKNRTGNTLVQSQLLDSDHRTAINQGAKFSFSAYIGGYSNHADPLNLYVEWMDPTNRVLGKTSVPGVTPKDRNNTTKMLPRSTSGTVPAGTVKFKVTVETALRSGTWQDSYADNIVLTITN